MSSTKIIIGIVVIAIAVGAYFLFQSPRKAQAPSDNQQTQQTSETSNNNQTMQPEQTPTVPDKAVAVIDTSLGKFEVTLDGKAAPKTVTNFIKLANEKYCDNTKFHRILKDFVIQGCDPNSKTEDASSWGQGGPGYTIPAEIGLKANVGAIGMASTAAKGPSSGSQFFIVTQESADIHGSLDGNYTFFGYVTSGMDVVTKIASVAVQPNLYGEASLPINAVVIKSVTIKQ